MRARLMALHGVSFVLPFVVWDTVANAPKTGDAANLALRWVKDGVDSATTNAPSEVSAVAAPGLYKVTITAAEAQCTFGALGGSSTTPGVSVMPVMVPFERLPNAAPGAAGGLALHDAVATVQTRIGTPTGASLSADVASVQADTNDLQTRIGPPATTIAEDILAIEGVFNPPSRRRETERSILAIRRR